MRSRYPRGRNRVKFHLYVFYRIVFFSNWFKIVHALYRGDSRGIPFLEVTTFMWQASPSPCAVTHNQFCFRRATSRYFPSPFFEWQTCISFFKLIGTCLPLDTGKPGLKHERRAHFYEDLTLFKCEYNFRLTFQLPWTIVNCIRKACRYAVVMQ